MNVGSKIVLYNKQCSNKIEKNHNEEENIVRVIKKKNTSPYLMKTGHTIVRIQCVIVMVECLKILEFTPVLLNISFFSTSSCPDKTKCFVLNWH